MRTVRFSPGSRCFGISESAKLSSAASTTVGKTMPPPMISASAARGDSACGLMRVT